MQCLHSCPFELLSGRVSVYKVLYVYAFECLLQISPFGSFYSPQLPAPCAAEKRLLVRELNSHDNQRPISSPELLG